MEQKDVILDAIIRANKLGARGIKVTGFTEPTDATGTWCYSLVVDTDPDRLKPASAKAWYEG